jgi:hypothetical protein
VTARTRPRGIRRWAGPTIIANVGAFPELLQALAQRLTDIAQLAWAKNEHHDRQNDEQMPRLKSAHSDFNCLRKLRTPLSGPSCAR